MTQLAVTDTHGLIWYAQARWNRLGARARDLYRRVDAGEAVLYIPTLVLAELSEASHRGAVRFERGFTDWVDRLLSSGHFYSVDLTVEIVVRAEALYAIPERGDRLIAATAAHLGYPLVTRDPEIARAAGVQVIW